MADRAKTKSGTHVVTCFLRADGEVLLLRRSGEVGSYPGLWGAVAGHAEGDPDEAAWREIFEETGFEDVSLARKGDAFSVPDEELEKTWIVHPYLFDTDRRAPQLNWESDCYEWVSPTEILDRKVVPDLWKSYRYVAPSLEGIRNDRRHGSAYISLRALEVLRDRAAVTHSAPDLRDLAVRLIESRSSMAAVRNRINRVMDRAGNGLPAARQVHDVLREAVENDRRAAARAADRVVGRTVLTLSRSGTVVSALADARPRVLISRSWPGGEGAGVAEELASRGCDVTLFADASMASISDFDVVLVGADTILPDGSLINKTGTYLAALVARERSMPFYAASSIDKILTAGEPEIEEAPASAIYDGEAPFGLIRALLERTPAHLVTGYMTERGVLAPSDISDVAKDLRAMEAWRTS